MNKELLKAYYWTLFVFVLIFFTIRFANHPLFTWKISRPVIIKPALSPFQQKITAIDSEIGNDQSEIYNNVYRYGHENEAINKENDGLKNDLDVLYKERQDIISKGDQ